MLEVEAERVLQFLFSLALYESISQHDDYIIKLSRLLRVSDITAEKKTSRTFVGNFWIL
jgi:hypothetical protein